MNIEYMAEMVRLKLQIRQSGKIEEETEKLTQFFLLIQNFPFTGPKEGRIFRCLMSEWLRLKHIFVHRIHIMITAVYIIRVDFTNLVIIVQ